MEQGDWALHSPPLGLVAKMLWPGEQGIHGLRNALALTFPWKGVGMYICTPIWSRETRFSEKEIRLWRSKTFSLRGQVEAVELML